MCDLAPEEQERLRSLGVEPAAVARAARALASVLRSGGKVLVFGNGGSAADAQHMAAEFVGRFELERAPLPAIALTTDTSAVTAIANDYGFEHIFARQVEALGAHGDVAVAISTSGGSANVLQGVQTAARLGITTIGLCGAPDCRLCELVDIAVVASREGAALVQEAHIVVEHALCRAVERELFSAGNQRVTHPPGTVIALGELLDLRAGWAACGRVVVWTNGCFDIVHAGHLASLARARELGDVLVVGVNSDASVRRLKGEGRPLLPAAERAALLAALRPVDYVVIFDEDTPEAVLSRLQPEIHCKGADYGGTDGKVIPERAVVEAYGGRVELLPLVPGRSTSELVREIRGAGG